VTNTKQRCEWPADGLAAVALDKGTNRHACVNDLIAQKIVEFLKKAYELSVLFDNSERNTLGPTKIMTK
jgi:hypothetical protein